MRIRKIPIAATLLAAFTAQACGPQFELLLPTRAATLAEPTSDDFGSAARQLAPPLRPAARPPTDAASAALAGLAGEPTAGDRDRALAQAEGLSGAQADAIATARASATGDAAFAAGAALPPAYRLYAAAAVDFKAGLPPDTCDATHDALRPDAAHCFDLDDTHAARLRQAAVRFEQILQLDDSAASARAAWAAFSLGRLRHALGEPDAAVAAFELTRLRAARGASDPLRLATASLGEQARVEYERGNAARAVTLYEEQAASGGDDADVAVQSLQQVAWALYRDHARLAPAVADPVLQRLVLKYALSLGGLYDDAESAPADPAPAWARTLASPRSRLNDLLDLLAAAGARPGAVQDADRVAALAYRGGRYPLAARFAAQSHSPLALWIQAKLALRAGRKDVAAARYAQAVEAMAASQGSGSTQVDGDRLRAEAGTIRLARGEFTASLELWFAVGDRYWLDLAYVADRAVTTNELKAFVDAHVPAGKDGKPDPARDQGDEMMNHIDDNGPRLRDLLARRLMRDGRVDEAIAYFHAPCPCAEFGDVRALAIAYRQGLRDTRAATTPLQRATTRFATAQLVREHGLELFGSELGPDDMASEGEFDFEEAPPVIGPFVSAAEVARYKRSRVTPDGRFHYRGQAALLAARAAGDLPPKSQAYAAVLCRAASWTKSRQPDISSALYKRYVRTGAPFAWAAHFDSDCPAPDFKSLR